MSLSAASSHPLTHVLASENPLSVQIFCKVIDNYGDIGVSWRLARQLMREYDAAVTLIVDDLATFSRLLPIVDASLVVQTCTLPYARYPLQVVYWEQEQPQAVWERAGQQLPTILVEAFGCELPAVWHQALAQQAKTATASTCWINLEYLSAEDWVESCHAVQSFPATGGRKTFFFPGFTPATGGLLREEGLISRRQYFQQSQTRIDDFFESLGVPQQIDAIKVSLFCYPFSPVANLVQEWISDRQPVIVIAPGMSAEKLGLLAEHEIAGEQGCRLWQQGNLTLVMPPFLSLDDYDTLLWACDFNFVRGEDSFVRAQWAARPFIWNIYPQEELAHEVKLMAFLERYHGVLPNEQQAAMTAAMLAWNQPDAAPATPGVWAVCRASIQPWAMQARAWAWHLSQHRDLAASLIRFYQDTTTEIS